MTPQPPHADQRLARHWRVYAGDLAVLELSDAPGALTSTARDPGRPPVIHPFVTARALDAAHEDALRRLLVTARDADDFVRALVGAGYRVVAQ